MVAEATTHFSYSWRATLKSKASSRSLNATPMKACFPGVIGEKKCVRKWRYRGGGRAGPPWRNNIASVHTSVPWAFWILSTK